MKKPYHLTFLILLMVVVLTGCAPSWQRPIMGPDPVSRPKTAPDGGEIAEQIQVSPGHRKEISVTPTQAIERTRIPAQTIEPTATGLPAAQPVSEVQPTPGTQLTVTQPPVEDLPFDLPPPTPVVETFDQTLLYVGPGREFDAVLALPPLRRADIVGRNLDNSWLAISGPDDVLAPHVWVAAEDVLVEGDVHLVPILEDGL